MSHSSQVPNVLRKLRLLLKNEGYTEQHEASLGPRHGSASGRQSRLFSSLLIKVQWFSEFCEEELPALLYFVVARTNNAAKHITCSVFPMSVCGKKSCALFLPACLPAPLPSILPSTQCYACWCQGQSWHHRPCYLAI